MGGSLGFRPSSGPPGHPFIALPPLGSSSQYGRPWAFGQPITRRSSCVSLEAPPHWSVSAKRCTIAPVKEDFALIRLILVGTLLLLALSFFLQNQEQEVTLRYFFGLRSTSILIYKPILASFGVGLLVSGILLFPPRLH